MQRSEKISKYPYNPKKNKKRGDVFVKKTRIISVILVFAMMLSFNALYVCNLMFKEIGHD